jgi:adenylate cyclase
MLVIDELKRRKVFRVGAAYLIMSWVIIQVVGAVSAPLNLPETLDTVVIVLLAVGFPVSLFLA